MKKINKKQQGFTLVEVIVVAVIVAVLAAVAIPLYTGYIKDSRVNVCRNTAASIATTITSAIAQSQNQVYSANWIIGDNKVSVPSIDNASIMSNINLPKDYTVTVTEASGLVTVNGPGQSYGTSNFK